MCLITMDCVHTPSYLQTRQLILKHGALDVQILKVHALHALNALLKLVLHAHRVTAKPLAKFPLSFARSQ